MIQTWFTDHSDILLVGLSSSLIFFFIIFAFFRPYFYISKKISLNENGIYRFKIINFTFSKIIDFKVFIRKGVLEDAYPNGHNLQFNPLKLESEGFVYVEGSIKGMLSSQRPNCIQVKASRDQDLKEIIRTDNTYLDLIVIARHSKTNLQTTKIRTFKHVKIVKKGMFESGFTTKIS